MHLITGMIACLLMTLLCACGSGTKAGENQNREDAQNEQHVQSTEGISTTKNAVDNERRETAEEENQLQGIQLQQDYSDPVAIKGELRKLQFIAQAGGLEKKGRLKAAHKAYVEALKFFPKDAYIKMKLAHNCIMLEDYECVRAEASAIAKSSLDDPLLKASSFHFLGKALEKEGKKAQAFEMFKKSLDFQPSSTLVEHIQTMETTDRTGVEKRKSVEVKCLNTDTDLKKAVESAKSASIVQGHSLCSVPDVSEPEKNPGNSKGDAKVIAALKKHTKVESILGDHAGLGAEGDFPLFVLHPGKNQPVVLTLNEGGNRDRKNEIIKEITSKVHSMNIDDMELHVVEISTQGWWNVDQPNQALGFKRTELYLFKALLKGTEGYVPLEHQVTFEQGFLKEPHCIYGEVAKKVEKRGKIWFEDLDVDGVLELCQETTLVPSPLPSWMEIEAQQQRIKVQPYKQKAASLRKAQLLVPPIVRNQISDESLIHGTGVISRWPYLLRQKLLNKANALKNRVVLNSENANLGTDRNQPFSVLADEQSVHILTLSKSGSLQTLKLGKIGRWNEVWAKIDSGDPRLLKVFVEAYGDLAGASMRHWLYLIDRSTKDGIRLVLATELDSQVNFDRTPCPSIIVAEHKVKTRNNKKYYVIDSTKKTGPGKVAHEALEQQKCELFEPWIERLANEEALPQIESSEIPELRCTLTTENLPQKVYVQSPDGMFVAASLPETK